MQTQLNVAIGIATRVAIDEFDCPHTSAGINDFFLRVTHCEQQHGAIVSVAMDGFGGYACPAIGVHSDRGAFHLALNFDPPDCAICRRFS